MRRTLIILLLLVLGIAAAGIGAYQWWVYTPTAEWDDQPGALPADGKLRVLILGVDPGWVEPGKTGVGRSDTMMMASFDPATREASLLSIPRDCRVEIPGHDPNRINHAYAYGGVELARQTVQNFLQVPIRYFIKIDVTGFARLVDAIGGVTINVEKDMDWDDNAGNLHIHLKQGIQTLNGEDALDYVRFRHSDDDFARASRQQQFIAEAIKQALKPSSLLKLPELIKIAFQTVETNLPLTTVLRHSVAASDIIDNLRFYTVEGSDAYINGAYYFLPDREKLEQLVDTWFYAGVDRQANGQVRVSVRYGNGNRQSADQVVAVLSKAGFQVQPVLAADRADHLVTEVISVSRDTAGALRVAELVSTSEVLLDPEAGSGTDVVVILGKDMLPGR